MKNADAKVALIKNQRVECFSVRNGLSIGESFAAEVKKPYTCADSIPHFPVAVQRMPSLSLQTPQSKALVATILGVLLLAAAGGAGFWYGTRAEQDEATPTVQSNVNSAATSATAQAASLASLSGKISKVEDDALEVTMNATAGGRIVRVRLNKETVLRKLDFRSIPKTGIGDGVAIQSADLKAGQSVVVIAQDVSQNPVDAEKVILVIYP